MGLKSLQIMGRCTTSGAGDSAIRNVIRRACAETMSSAATFAGCGGSIAKIAKSTAYAKCGSNRGGTDRLAVARCTMQRLMRQLATRPNELWVADLTDLAAWRASRTLIS